jgi:hypothetical protein
MKRKKRKKPTPSRQPARPRSLAAPSLSHDEEEVRRLRPPRRVRIRREHRLGLAVRTILTLAVWVVMIGLVGWLLGLLLFIGVVDYLGTNVEAHVIGRSFGNKGQDPRILVTYPVGDAVYQASVMVPYESVKQWQIGDPVLLRVASWAPGWHPVAPGNLDLMNEVFPLPMVPLCFVGVVSLLLIVAAREVWLQRYLTGHGSAVVGQVTDLTILRGKSRTYRVRYSYPATQGSKRFETTMDVTKEQYNTVTVGRPILVLYDLKRPGRSVLYRFSRYLAEPPATPKADSSATMI